MWLKREKHKVTLFMGAKRKKNYKVMFGSIEEVVDLAAIHMATAATARLSPP
jgi:hypothetical protein